ncbi:integrase core domain-containing protein [Deinococcus aquaedulcis]|uniref:integrase core domain-containing protein n=1 Tax=Deinococcus aquaedulcis TaxID=2840455 RepID=UPI0038B345DF
MHLKFIRSDNGPEFIARALDVWLAVQDIGTRFIQPGTPWQKGFAKSFYSRLRDECLNQEVFYSARHAQVLLDDWRSFSNTRQSHSSLSAAHPTSVPSRPVAGLPPPSADRNRGGCGRPDSWASEEGLCCTLLIERISTRIRPNFGARPSPAARSMTQTL